MLSAIVIMPSHPVRGSARSGPEALARAPEALVRTLAALVPAAVEGVLRDLTIAAALGIAGLERVADHAGCELVRESEPRGALIKALSGTRETNVFLIVAGRAPETGFTEELAEFLRDGHRQAIMRVRPDTFITRLLPGFSPAAALLAPREKLTAIAAGELSYMSRRLGAAQTLRCRARRVD